MILKTGTSNGQKKGYSYQQVYEIENFPKFRYMKDDLTICNVKWFSIHGFNYHLQIDYQISFSLEAIIMNQKCKYYPDVKVEDFNCYPYMKISEFDSTQIVKLE